MAGNAEFPDREIEECDCKGGVDGPVYVRCESCASAGAWLRESLYVQRYRSLTN